MPLYTYRNPKTGKTKDIIQSMNEPHVYSEGGIEWQRVFTVPQASIDTKIDPYDSKDFVEKSKTKKGTVGDLWDKSQELSNKRAHTEGYDPKKQKYYNHYKNRRRSKIEHPDVQKAKIKEKLSGVADIEF